MNSEDLHAQSLKDTAGKFWEAVKIRDDSNIVSNGLILLDFIQKENYLLDSLSVQISMYTASSLNKLSRKDEALRINNEVLRAVESHWGIDNYYYATILNNIALIYSDRAAYDVALEMNLKALRIYESLYGLNHICCALSFDNIASSYKGLNKLTKALEANLKALEIRRVLFGGNNKDYALCMARIASDYFAMENYSRAVELGSNALEIFRENGGFKNPYMAICLSNLANAFSKTGEFEKSKNCYLEALTQTDRHSVQYGVMLNNLAMNYIEIGEYAEALNLNLSALSVFKSVMGEHSVEYAKGLNYLGLTYSELGENDKALQCNLESVNLIFNIKGPQGKDYLLGINNLIVNFMEVSEYSKALEYGREALLRYKEAYGVNDRRYAMVLSNIAIVFSKMGDYESALNYNLQALDIRSKYYANSLLDLALCFNNLSVNYSDLGDYENARKYALKSLKGYESIYGIWHPDYAKAIGNLALIHSKTGFFSEAILAQKESFLIRERFFYLNRFGLDISTVNFSRNELDNSFLIIGCLLSRDSSLSDFASRSWLNLNGIVGSEASNLESQIESNGDTASVHLLADLKLNKKQLAKYRELTKEEKTSRDIDEKALEDEVSRQERELSKQSKAFADFNRRFNLKDVSSALKGDEVFVDIARVPYFSTYTNQWTDSVKYLVFIHDAKDSLVDYRFIDNGKELEGDVFADYKIDCSNQANATDLKNALYYNAFWKPIADKIGSSKTVYVSLGGVYNNINLNTLYNPETGKYLVEEKDIRIVNNARDFVLSKEQTERTYTSTSTALYGFPDYNGIETATKDTTDYLALTRDLDPLWIDSLTRGGLKAAPLPATKIEVEQIAKSFKENGWQVSEYLGDKASETNIKQEERPRVLHIATHGYFFDDIPTDKSNNERFLGMDRQRVVQDPMLRSGLLFTGANKTLQGEKVEGENGLLSASEASLLNLRGTELVVLSACETGKGEVKNSEGVYGLRKAFSDAGAANTIMSLWKVDDKVTQEFMTRFYEIWLNEKTSIREAFNRTQLEIKAKYPQPYYWGAFVLVGV